VRDVLHLAKTNRSYDPQTIEVMTAALERVCQSVPPQINSNDKVRQAVALIILRYVDHGEHDDPVRLSDNAFRELAGIRPLQQQGD
jgi:hypothetical protein